MDDEQQKQPEGLPEEVETEVEEEMVEAEVSKKPAPKKKPLPGIAVIGKLSIKTYITIILAMVAVILILIFVFHSNFRANEIHVSGNNRVSTEVILEASGVKKNDHLLKHISGSWSEIAHFQDGKARQRILDADPYIAEAKVYPKYPGEIYIEITERRKVAYVAIPDGYAIISDDSVVLDIETGDVPKGIPEIRGLPILSAQIGKKLEMSSQDGYNICITILGAILNADSSMGAGTEDFDFLAQVISIRYCDNMTTFVDLSIPNTSKILTVKIGSLETISDDMNWLRYAVISGEFDDKPGSVFDMTGRQFILRE